MNISDLPGFLVDIAVHVHVFVHVLLITIKNTVSIRIAVLLLMRSFHFQLITHDFLP